MPPDHRLGLHEDKDVKPARPQPTEHDPEQSVGSADPGPATAVGEGGELLPEGKVLEHEVGARSDG